MNTQKVEIDFLSDDELDAVVGGEMNNGTGHLYSKPPITGSGGGITFVDGFLGGTEVALALGLALG